MTTLVAVGEQLLADVVLACLAQRFEGWSTSGGSW
jgi:hypothetical protein